MSSATAGPPLVVTRDDALLDEVLRVAAAAGHTPEVTGEPGVALRSWATAGLVLVGTDLAPDLARLGPARRAGVHLAACATVRAEDYPTALALGAESVVELPAGSAWLSEQLTDLGDGASAAGTVVGVAGGSGGVGATTLACALAQLAARGGPTALVDLDPLGPGCDRVLGLDGLDGVRWGDLMRTTGRIAARSLREALPRADGPGVLTWAEGERSTLPAATVRESLSAAARGHETVVLDLPRAADELVDEVVVRCDRLVLVVVPTVAGVSSAMRVLARLPAGRTVLVTRGQGVPVAELASVAGVPVVAALPHQRRLAEAVDLGLGPLRSTRGPWVRACRAVLGAA